jgi:hypothetical protein
MALHMGFGHVGNGNAHRQLAAPRHGIAGVNGKVEQNLLHHTGIGFDHGGGQAVIQSQRHILAQHPAQHIAHVADDFVHVQSFGLDKLAAAESEQLAGQTGGAFSGLADLLGGARRQIVEVVRLEQRGMAMNHREDIVEIMRHTAGQLADGLHFL